MYSPLTRTTKLPDLLLPIFSGIALLLLFVGPFCWPAMNNSSESSLRVALLLGFFTAVLSHRKPVMDLNLLIFLSFWIYLFLNAFFFGNAQMMRRLAVILIFVYVSAIALKDFCFCRKWISIVTAAIAFCALFSIVSHMVFGELTLSYRLAAISGSGFENFAEFHNSVDAGTYYAPALAFAIWLALTEKKRIAIVGWALCAFIIAVFLYFTYARTAWLACMAFVVILFMFAATPRVRNSVFWIMGIAILLAMIFVSDVILYELTERGLTFRDEIWSNVISRLPGHWMFGYGAGADTGPFSIGNENQIVWHVHNLYLQILYQFGLSGLILMLIASTACLVKLFRLRSNALASLWLAILSGGLLSMFFAMNNFVGSPNRIWIYFWLPVAGCLALAENGIIPTRSSPAVCSICRK
ncbi:MAG: O-antigen ligase family protein [Azoarcus sp.]|jgi:O-antigen ligase|nr:O-antigen ligase family protein [Azoarcus sp.]